MFDPKKLLTDLMNGDSTSGKGNASSGPAGQIGDFARNNPIAVTGIAALLLGTKKGRKIGGSAIKLGGMAAIAGLAYSAWKNYQAGQSPQQAETELGNGGEVLPPPPDTGFDPSAAPQGEDEFALALVRAMIAAARADGHIDAEERARIEGKLEENGVEKDAAEFIRRELAAPTDLDAIVATAQTDAQKVELYTASRVAIEPDSRAERGYLDMLAGRLGLPDALVDSVDSAVAAAKN